MGMVKYEGKFKFPSGHVWVIFDAGEETEYGYEIDLTGEDGFGGTLHGINNWSFGYEEDSRDLWSTWGDYLCDRLEAIEGDEQALEDLINELDQIDCRYLKYEVGQEEINEHEHQRDLAVIKELISSNSYQWKGMKKISFEEAQTRFRNNQEVYLLYSNNTEALAERIEDLYAHRLHGESFGYEK